MHRIEELVSGMAQAAAANGTLAAARRLARARNGGHPAQGRCRECLAPAVPSQAGEILAASAALQLSLLAVLHNYTRAHKSASHFAVFWFSNTRKNATEQGANFCTSV